MPKEHSKATLLEEIRAERKRLEKNLSTFSPEDKVKPGMIGEWSIKDVMAHLMDWEQRFIGWYQAGKQGETFETPAPGLTWGQLHILNQQIYETHKDRSLEDVQVRFDASYQHIVALIEGMTEEELFNPGYYAWNGGHALVGWAAANTSHHYRWAKTEIRKSAKERA